MSLTLRHARKDVRTGPGRKGVKVGRAFQNRSFLYRFNVAMDPGVQAARWCLSQEMSKMQGRVKDVCAVVERHTVRLPPCCRWGLPCV